MDTIPNTTDYMTAGFVVSFLTLGIYVLSIYIRNKNLKRDLDTLEDMEKSEKK
jgi:hypothetical protein